MFWLCIAGLGVGTLCSYLGLGCLIWGKCLVGFTLWVFCVVCLLWYLLIAVFWICCFLFVCFWCMLFCCAGLKFGGWFYVVLDTIVSFDMFV